MYHHFPKTMKLVTAVRQIRLRGCAEFTSLQCMATGTTDTAGNLAYHVQQPDPFEGMMNKLKKKKDRGKERNLVGKRQTKILAFQWPFT